MEKWTVPGILKDYCYGPVDLLDVRQGSDDMRLTLRTADGRTATAHYHGCVYWQFDHTAKGKRLPLVRCFTADELLSQPKSPCLCLLARDTGDAGEALREWEAEGLRFYLHDTAERGEAYLVAARKLEYEDRL